MRSSARKLDERRKTPAINRREDVYTIGTFVVSVRASRRTRIEEHAQVHAVMKSILHRADQHRFARFLH